MANSRRAFHVFLALILSLLFAIISTTNTSAAATLKESQGLSGHRQVSPFVRRNLQGMGRSSDYSRSAASAARSYDVYTTMSGGSRVRRLAGSANCSSTPSVCSDAKTFSVGASCCASTGSCVDLQTDRNNCGFCAYSCASSLGCCSGLCVSLMTDNANCGTCATSCVNSLCSAGICGYAS